MESLTTSWFIPLPRSFPPFRWFIALLCASFLVGCDSSSPSEIEQTRYHQTNNSADIGATLGIDDAQSAFDSQGYEYLYVDAGRLSYSDAGLLVDLNGQVHLPEGGNNRLTHTLWRQTSGPEATLINAHELSAHVILPHVEAATHIEFALSAADNQNRVAEDRVRIRVLPLERGRLAATVEQSRFTAQVLVTLTLSGTLSEPVTIQYATQDGSAIAGEDYIPEFGEITLDSENSQATLIIDLLSQEPSTGDRYFTLHYTANHGSIGNQRSYVVLRGIDPQQLSACELPGDDTGYLGLQTTGNPFADAQLYVDPDYVQYVESSQASLDPASPFIPAMEIVKQQPTAIWLDSIEMLDEGEEFTQRRSLSEHLELATALQNTAAGEVGMPPLTMQLVLFNSPRRDPNFGSVSALGYSEEDLQAYREQYIDRIKELVEAHPSIRFVFYVEPNAVPELLGNNSLLSAHCEEEPAPEICTMIQNSYHLVQYAVDTLARVESNNAYIYLDIGGSTRLSTTPVTVNNFLNTLLADTGLSATDIKGFSTNTANYTPTQEEFVTSWEPSGFYSDRNYIDEQSLIEAIHSRFTGGGYDHFSYVIDTSRNGWGGFDRPFTEGDSEQRLDRRTRAGSWCNVANAGIGERPQANPSNSHACVDAFTWIKQPGVSDGTSEQQSVTLASGTKSYTHFCGPDNPDALQGSPFAAEWFHEHFMVLIDNAWPELLEWDFPG